MTGLTPIWESSRNLFFGGVNRNIVAAKDKFRMASNSPHCREHAECGPSQW